MRRATILSTILTMFVAAGCGGGYQQAAMAPTYGDFAADEMPMEARMGAGAGAGPSTGRFEFDDVELSGELERPMAGVAEAGKTKGKAEQAGADGAPSVEPPKERVIIYVADMGLFVFDVDETLTKLTEATRKQGGWVQASTSTTLTIRVPVQNFRALVAEIETLGDLDYKNVTGTDVTEEFFDLQIRLSNSMALRQRYIELLEKATKVEESLAIEKELGRITEDIERVKGRLKFLKAHASNSTISVSVTKKPDVPPSRRGVALPFYWLRSYSLENVFY